MNSHEQIAAERMAWWQRAFGVDLRHAVLIDVGAGTGLNAASFVRHVRTVRAIDANNSVRPDQAAGVEWFHGTVPDSHECPLNEADLVLCTNVLEHVDPRQLRPFVRGCWDLLKPGGHAFFSWAPVWSHIGAHIGNRPHVWEHLRLSPSAWHVYLREHWGDEFADAWFRHEWRPGLSRRDWLDHREHHATIQSLAIDLVATGFEIRHHNLRASRHRDAVAIWPELLECIDCRSDVTSRPSLLDFVAASDTWMVRKGLKV